MKKVIFILCLISLTGFSQNSDLPFELERYSNYQIEEPETEEVDALVHYYFELYKQERALLPGSYFPEANGLRKETGEKIRFEFPSHPSINLLDFLENGCNGTTIEALNAIDGGSSILLPYRFIAAFTIGDEEREVKLLNSMLREGMISDVLKSWGIAAMYSSLGFESVLTNGIQDLIAVRYAQLVENINPQIDVANSFVQGCGMSTEPSSFGGMWFAPTLKTNVINPFSSRLKIVGIGFAFQVPTSGDRMKKVAQELTKSKSKNPADQGLVQSYAYLQKGLEVTGYDKEARELKNYIEKQGK